MSADTIIAMLVNDSASGGFEAEHGFSLWINSGETRILFDTGAGATVVPNARSMGIDLADIDMLILSHGHFDHTGGLADVLNLSRTVRVYAHPGIVQPRYSVRNGMARSIAMPTDAMVALNALPEERIHWVQQPVHLTESIGLTGPIPRTTDYEDTGGPFYLDQAGTKPDPLDDDMALWIATDAGLIVCVGCAHAGIVNTVLHIRRLNGNQRIRALIGGMHLHSASIERLDETCAELSAWAPDIIIPAHCTGKTAIERFKAKFGEVVRCGEAGMSIRLSNISHDRLTRAYSHS